MKHLAPSKFLAMLSVSIIMMVLFSGLLKYDLQAQTNKTGKLYNNGFGNPFPNFNRNTTARSGPGRNSPQLIHTGSRIPAPGSNVDYLQPNNSLLLQGDGSNAIDEWPTVYLQRMQTMLSDRDVVEHYPAFFRAPIFSGTQSYSSVSIIGNTINKGASLTVHPESFVFDPVITRSLEVLDQTNLGYYERSGSVSVTSSLIKNSDGTPMNSLQAYKGPSFVVGMLQTKENSAGVPEKIWPTQFTVRKIGDIDMGDPNFSTYLNAINGIEFYKPPVGSGTRVFFNGGDDKGSGSSNDDLLYMHRYNYSNNVTSLRVNVGDDNILQDKFEVGYYEYTNNEPTWKEGIALYANGEMFARKATVTLSNYPDYVFRKDYKLATLSEIEHTIGKEGRLPGMPSAKEVAEKGLDLGEQNRLLVEKIEELTLHLIRMQKEIDALKTK
jgi:hypothetical protein